MISVGVSLEHDDDVAAFLGVRMKADPATALLELKQMDLLD